MDIREERRRWCMELATKHARNGAQEIMAATREYETFLAELDVKPAEPPQEERPAPGRKANAKQSGNPQQLP